MGWESGRGRRGSHHSWGRGATAPSSASISARAASTRQAAGLPLAPRGVQRLRDADGDPVDDVDHGRQDPLSAEDPDHVLGRGTAEPGGDEVGARPVRITVLDFYGLTESYPLCANFPFMEVRAGSMGQPMPGWGAILDEDERPVAAGERGEICRARAGTRTTRSATGTGLSRTLRRLRRRLVLHPERPRPTRTATTGMRAARRRESRRATDWALRGGVGVLEHPAVAEAAGGGARRAPRLVKAFVVLSAGHDPSDALAGGTLRRSCATICRPTPTRG